jgi:predicted HicB family RNase H-like nuclease
MAQEQAVRQRIPAVLHKKMKEAAEDAGISVKFWLYDAIKEKFERDAKAQKVAK